MCISDSVEVLRYFSDLTRLGTAILPGTSGGKEIFLGSRFGVLRVVYSSRAEPAKCGWFGTSAGSGLHRDDLRVVGFALRPTTFSETALCGSAGSVALRLALSGRVTESEVGFALRPISVALNYLRVVLPMRPPIRQIFH